MRIVLEIPKELEEDFKKDKFEDFFCRINADIDNEGLCGLYEKEIARMLMKAFKDSTKYSVKEKIVPVANIKVNPKDLDQIAIVNNKVKKLAINKFADYLHKCAVEHNGLYISGQTKSWTHDCIYDYVKEFMKQKENK